MPPPVAGAGELERETKGLNDDVTAGVGSLLPSSNGDSGSELESDEVSDAAVSISSAPSVFAAGSDAVVVGVVSGTVG